MTRVLDVLEDYLDWRGFEHLRLDGAVSSADRGDLVHQFNKPGAFASFKAHLPLITAPLHSVSAVLWNMPTATLLRGYPKHPMGSVFLLGILNNFI